MKIFYQDCNFKPASLRLIEHAGKIIDEFRDDGYTPTVRQLYYQFVVKNLLPNSERSYKNLGNLITKARMAGLISWSAIEDRNRSCHSYYYEEDVSTIFNGMEGFITYDLWARQEYYVEVWIEKDALSQVAARPCEKWRVPYMACKGYLSASEAWRAGRRFKHKAAGGKNCVLLHLGDHDPSGVDMTRDNEARLSIFAEESVEVRRLALNMDQIRKYKPPPNPAKESDVRGTGYIEKYGEDCWELDALKPQIIEKLIEDNIKKLIDLSEWNRLIEEEEDAREPLRKLPQHVDKILKYAKNL